MPKIDPTNSLDGRPRSLTELNRDGGSRKVNRTARTPKNFLKKNVNFCKVKFLSITVAYFLLVLFGDRVNYFYKVDQFRPIGLGWSGFSSDRAL